MSTRLIKHFKTLITFLLIILIIPSSAIGLSVEDLGKNVVFLRLQQQAYEIVEGKKVEVWYKINDEKYEPKKTSTSGTGFIIYFHGKDYLVTAKHVANFLSKDAEIILNIHSGSSIIVPFSTLERSQIIPGAKWFYHPIADIAIHPLVYPQKIDHVSYPIERCAKEDKDIPLLSTVYVLGFPLALGVQETLNPSAKKVQTGSKFISVDNPNINPDLKYILLDQAIAQGYSGAPVFFIEDVMSGAIKQGSKPLLKVGEKVSLIGVVSAQLPDSLGGKISLIVPISYICEILESKDFVTYENNLKMIK